MTGFCVASVKLFGPVHAYEAPEIVLAVRLMGVPRQTGELLPAAGAEGVSLIVTETVPGALGGHPPTTALTEYVPLAAVVTETIFGFCSVELKLLGPLHE